MDVIDYNGEGQWSRQAILARYSKYAAHAGIVERDLSPMEHSERGRHWVYPVMLEVIEGIKADDPACVRIGLEFIEEDARFPFGKMLKSNTARALRRATLSEDQKRRVRRRVFGMLRAGQVPREYREYAKLVKEIGFDPDEVPDVDSCNAYVMRFRTYFDRATRVGDPPPGNRSRQ